MKKIKNTLIAICGLTSLLLLTLYFPFAGLLKFNFGIYGFNAYGEGISVFIFLLCMVVTGHLDLNLKGEEVKKDEMSEEDYLLINKLERNPDLFNRVLVEMRKRKINKLKQKI